MTQKQPVMAIVLAVTALVVLIPVIIQMRTDGRRFADVWGHFVFVTGLLCVAAGYGLFDDARQSQLAIGGFIAAVIGLFIQHRDTDRDETK